MVVPNFTISISSSVAVDIVVGELEQFKVHCQLTDGQTHTHTHTQTKY